MTRRIIKYFISLQSVWILIAFNPVSAQNSDYFNREIQYDAKIKAFCNNSTNSDFAPFVWNDILFITSSRLTSKNRKNINPFTNKPFLNIYAFGSNCDSYNLSILPPDINKSLNCGPIAVSNDSSLVVITKNYSRANKNHVQNLFLAYYVKDKKGWSKEKMFPYNDVNYSLQHPYFDDRTYTLYFSSNLPGGNGSFDLYKSRWDGNSWGEPKNLGPGINSVYDEVFPCLTPEGDLIYTSDHTGNFGGLDIVLFKDNTRYLLPEPINTQYDDFSVSFNDEFSGYFASNRDSSTAGDNIYSFELNSKRLRSFMIRVIDMETKIPVPEVSVTIKADTPKIDNHIITSSQGEGILYKGTEDSIYASIELEKDGYLPLKTESGYFRDEVDFKIITLNMKKVPPPEDTLIVLGVPKEYDYYVIVNSFLDESRAQANSVELKRKLNKNVFILPKTEFGFHRVSIGKFADLDEALAVYKDARLNIDPDSWIFAQEK